MVFEIAALRDLPDSELDTLALAVATDVSRRAAARAAAQDQRPAGPEQETEELGPDPTLRQSPQGQHSHGSQLFQYTLRLTVWHFYRKCRHLASAKKGDGPGRRSVGPSSLQDLRPALEPPFHQPWHRRTTPQPAPMGGTKPQPLSSPCVAVPTALPRHMSLVRAAL